MTMPISHAEMKAAHPPASREAYDRAYASAALAREFASLAYELRTRAGLTQTELARRMGTTQSSIARIENSGSLPTIEMVSRLARATGASVHLSAPGVADIELGAA